MINRLIRNFALALIACLPAATLAQVNCLDAADGDPLCSVIADQEGNIGVGTEQLGEQPAVSFDVRGTIYFEGGTGDFDDDGSYGLDDILAMLDLLAASTIAPADYEVADINGDGRVSQDDLGILLELSSGASKEEAVQNIVTKYGMASDTTFVVEADARIDGSLQVGTIFQANPGFVNVGQYGSETLFNVNGPIYQRFAQLHADYVFEPEYQLETIEEHAEYMWREKHLKAVPAFEVDEYGREVVEIGAHRRGLLEELEKAHIYIAQLSEKVRQQAEQLAELDEVRTRLIWLEADFKELEN